MQMNTRDQLVQALMGHRDNDITIITKEAYQGQFDNLIEHNGDLIGFHWKVQGVKYNSVHDEILIIVVPSSSVESENDE